MQQNNQVQANVDEVINGLSQQVAQLTRDNAVLQSLVSQYQTKLDELQQELQQATNDSQDSE